MLASLVYLFALISIPTGSNGYSDKIYYDDDSFIGVNLDAGIYKFILNNRVFGIFRDYNCICEVFAGPYRDINWRNDGGNLIISIDNNDYLWSLDNNNFSNGCASCETD
ncbi:MAG: hypothetical protein ACD_51C00048G0004 [uncultured bacterium]|nr:MAG: hypothetical protein ACD_51C00048G0004 [uncultured bacterium]